MSSALDNLPASVPTNPSMMHVLQRHRDILYDYSKEFKKTKVNIASARDHAELLTSVREDIASWKSNAHASTTDYLLSERGRIDGTHRLADIVLEQAYETKDSLDRQRSNLSRSSGRVGNIGAQFPIINSLMSRINMRKKRDTVIMAGVISFCLILILWYLMSR